MAEILGIGQNTYTNWKKSLHDKRKGSSHPNNAKYSEEERQQALEALLLNPDMSPSELQAKYLDEHGVYLGSVKWLYRLLEKIKCNSKRGTDQDTTNELIIGQDMIHVYPLVPMPEAKEADEKIITAILR